jgi:hypothetical protein
MKYVGEARAKYNPKAPLIGVASLPVVAGGKQLFKMSQEATREPTEKWPTYKYKEAGLGIVVELSRNGECRITGPRKPDDVKDDIIDCPGIFGRVKINDVIVSIDSVPVAGLKLDEIEKAMVRNSQRSGPTQPLLSPTMYLKVENVCSEEQWILR